MNDPVTWWDLIVLYIWYELGGLAFSFAFCLLGIVVMSGYCESCGRHKQWRWKRPNPYARRRFCPFHDEGQPF